MESLESSLETLHLQSMPDERTLKRQFRKRLLEVHPDRNPGNRDAAEDATVALIRAYESLRELILSQPDPVSSHYRSHSGHPEPETFQIVVTSEAQFAMPVRWMKSVVRYEELIQKRGFYGAVVVHNNRMYPVFSVRGRNATARPGQTLALFEWPGGKAAMVLSQSVERFYTLTLDFREIFWSRKPDGSIRMIHGGRHMLFPAFLIDALESNPGVVTEVSEAHSRSGVHQHSANDSRSTKHRTARAGTRS
ncbi:MAG: J domain-containing protein [Leptospiraceae bacterium]|nr:J domain-containing protein [Leptospiraceae bacterium]